MNIDSQQSVFNKTRKDKFLLVLSLPNALKGINSQILTQRSNDSIQLETLQFSVWGTVVPDTVVAPVEMKMWGQAYKVTSQHRDAYPPISVNFTIDNRFSNYWLLWKWLDILNNVKNSGMPESFGIYEPGIESANKARELSNNIAKKSQNASSELELQQIHMVNNFLDYQTIMTIYGIDEYNSKIIRFDYYNAFITKLGGINYSYREPTEAESSFDFVFSQMNITLLNDSDS